MKIKIPDYIEGYGNVKHFSGVAAIQGEKITLKPREITAVLGEKPLYTSLETFFENKPPFNGMTLSFHHHLRNGDGVLNAVFQALEKYDVTDIKVVVSSLFPVHAPLVKWIESGRVVQIMSNYMSGIVAETISQGKMRYPAIMHTHGGRARAIESGDIVIDFAFIAAPSADNYGNINGVEGKSACGSLGYAVVDSLYAKHVVAVTDNLMPYPLIPIEIDQTCVDAIVVLESIGNPKGIVSGTTQITKDPLGLKIAKMASQVIENSPYFKNEFSFQTGAGGTSLAVAKEVKHLMKVKGIQGSFASGGITGYMVEMLEENLFRALFDVQCFDLEAIRSLRDNKAHVSMSASLYGNPATKGSVVNKLDVVILGATEIDTDFNVNVTTASNGVIMGGSGGHSDTAAGAKLTIIVTNLIKARLPIVKESVTTITTPGESVDVVVTERGIAINPKHTKWISELKAKGLPIFDITELKDMAENITGKPATLETGEKIVAIVEYRDGSVIDVVRQIKD